MSIFEDSDSLSGAAGFDIQRYAPHVEGHFETDDQAAEFLRTLWNIMCAFVDLGWGVDSIHFAFPELAEISTPEEADEVQSPHTKTIKEDVEAAFAKRSSLGDS